jgi:tetratricopeptide (TPR) repeat protein
MRNNRAYPNNANIANVQMPAKMSRLIATYNAGRYSELESDARELLEQFPTSGFVSKVLGVALQVQGKDAVQALQQACKLMPNDAEVHNNLGVALRDKRQLVSALQSYQRALSIKPAYAEAHNNRGIALYELGRGHDAVGSFRQALKINPKYVEAYNNLGNALQGLGKLEDAISNYRRALALRPNYAEAHNNLGKALHDLDLHDAAIASYRLALEIRPDYVDAHSNLALVLRDLGQHDAAVASCRKALALDPYSADAHNNMGIALQELGQLDAAVASFRRALEINCDFAEAHNNLGYVLAEQRQTDAAAASHRAALEINPLYAEAHVGLGQVQRLQGRTSAAQMSGQRALELNPNLAGVHLFSAELLTDQGQFAAAEDAYRRAIAIEPESAEAWSGISRTRKMTDGDATWLAEVKRIAAKSLPSRKEVFLRYAIGKYFDDTKDYEQAFFNYWRANEISKYLGNKYLPEHQTQNADRIIRIFDREWIDRLRVNANPSSRPIFIVGMPRSGTSLAEQILASHPSVFGAGELAYWQTAGKTVIQAQGAMAPQRERDDVLCSLADEYLKVLGEVSADSLRVVDKMPGNFMHLGLIHAAFPHARIIHMQRNPLDTCLSIYFQHFNASHDYANDLEDLAHYYTEYFRLMEHWRMVLPEDAILHVPYEGLVDNQEAWSRTMLEFVGLPWDARCLDFHQHVRTVSTTSNWQVRQKLSKSSVERWRNYEKFAWPLLHLFKLNSATI